MRERIEIIESVLGDKLSNTDILSIDKPTLIKIAEALYQLDSRNRYYLPPHKEGSVCPYIHPNSDFSPLLGISPDDYIYKSDRLYPDLCVNFEFPSSRHMRNTVNLLILYYDCICIPDPFCQFLGYLLAKGEITPAIRENINITLKFYADLRELLYDGSVILAPSTVWLPMSGRVVPPPELFGFATDFFTKKEWITDNLIKAFVPFEHSMSPALKKHLTASAIFHFFSDDVFESLKVADNFDYQLFFSNDLSEKIYLAYLNFLSSKLCQEERASDYKRLPVLTVKKLMPRTDKLDIKDILSLRQNSNAFNAFRHTLLEISRKLDIESDYFEEHPTELKKYVDDIISCKLDGINSEIQKSKPLQSVLDEVFNWEISIVSGLTIGLILNSIESGLFATIGSKGLEAFLKVIYKSSTGHDKRKELISLKRMYTKILTT